MAMKKEGRGGATIGCDIQMITGKRRESDAAEEETAPQKRRERRMTGKAARLMMSRAGTRLLNCMIMAMMKMGAGEGRVVVLWNMTEVPLVARVKYRDIWEPIIDIDGASDYNFYSGQWHRCHRIDNHDYQYNDDGDDDDDMNSIMQMPLPSGQPSPLPPSLFHPPLTFKRLALFLAPSPPPHQQDPLSDHDLHHNYNHNYCHQYKSLHHYLLHPLLFIPTSSLSSHRHVSLFFTSPSPSPSSPHSHQTQQPQLAWKPLTHKPSKTHNENGPNFFIDC